MAAVRRVGGRCSRCPGHRGQLGPKGGSQDQVSGQSVGQRWGEGRGRE